MIWAHIWNVLVYYFAWPYGNVYGNVWAIIPCGIIAVLWARAKLIRDEARHNELLAHIHKLHMAISVPDENDKQ